MRFRLSILIPLLPLLLRAGEEAAFFETRVRPLLAEHCLQCHGEKEAKGGLRLDTAAGLRAGGKDGPVVVPGKPEESLLIRAVRHEWNTAMPKDAPKLPPGDIAALEEWIRQGAPWPDSVVIAPVERAAKARRHWAYQPVRKSAPPLAPDGKTIRGVIDGFLHARIREQNLIPSAFADKPVFLRRAAQLLTGLPAAPDDTRRLLELPGDFHAWADQVVEHYLAQPAFGEKWGRHWLDVARYADNKGYVFQETRDYPYAYTYRDWVVRAYNEDLPYPEFIRRQLAADRMEVPPSELAALGFLTVGRRFLNNQHLIIDDRIDVLARGVLGTTLACARCHDHKSDPFTAQDYYGLYGIFASSEEPDEKPLVGGMADTPEARSFMDEVRKKADEIHAYVAGKIPDYEKPANPLDFDEKRFRKLEKPDRDKVREIMNKITEMEVASPHAPPRGMVVKDKDKPVEAHVFVRGNPDRRGDRAIRAFPEFLRADPKAEYANGSGRRELAEDIVRPDNPLTARVYVNRVWAVLMGRGLVDNMSDFGLSTAPPSHPELLDYLASTFTEHGGSTKALIREICASSAWRRSSDAGVEALKLDPENRWLSHFSRRRLDFESFRDHVLAASGNLVGGVGGRPEKIHEEPYSQRRTLYGYIDRQNLPGLFRTFDFANPDSHSPKRFQTTTAPQALFALNSPFLIEQSLALAERTRAEAGADATAQVTALYRRALNRVPDAGEIALAGQFLRESTDALEPPTDWAQGVGRVEGEPARVVFEPLPFFADNTWRGGPRLPDPRLSHASLSAGGGHPGPKATQAVIRRWTSSFDGPVTVSGTLRKPAKDGDGIRARVISSRAGQVAEWTVEPKATVKAEAGPFEVRKGDTLDFVVEPMGSHDHDTFEWAPVVREHREMEWKAEQSLGETNPHGPWTLGHGGVAEDGKSTTFTPFAHRTDDRWHAGPVAPDPTFAYALLGARGGHPGRSESQAVIRRWTSPVEGVLDLTGTLARTGTCPGQVRGRLVHARLGTLGQWVVDAQGKVATKQDGIKVAPGDTLDFVLDPLGTDTCDSFDWNSRLALRGPAPLAWDSRKSFRPGTLDPLAQLAQVLLMGNEFAFVD